jgi:hypothetical protein
MASASTKKRDDHSGSAVRLAERPQTCDTGKPAIGPSPWLQLPNAGIGLAQMLVDRICCDQCCRPSILAEPLSRCTYGEQQQGLAKGVEL